MDTAYLDLLRNLQNGINNMKQLHHKPAKGEKPFSPFVIGIAPSFPISGHIAVLRNLIPEVYLEEWKAAEKNAKLFMEAALMRIEDKMLEDMRNMTVVNMPDWMEKELKVDEDED